MSGRQSGKCHDTIRLKLAAVRLASRNMRWQTIPVLILAATLTACSSLPKPKPIPVGSLKKFEAKAKKFHSVVSLPTFETTPDAVKTTTEKAIRDGNLALDTIGALKPGEVNFVNTIRALEIGRAHV